MSFSKRINISISPLRLHSASAVQIPSSTRKFNTMLPSIKIHPLNILSESSVNLHGITNSNVFHSNIGIRLPPLISPILLKYTNPFKRCGMYPSISKCNAKRCKCCKHFITKSTVTSSVNGRQFSVIRPRLKLGRLNLCSHLKVSEL